MKANKFGQYGQDPIEKISCILEPTNKIGGLYLGNIAAASSKELITKYEIKGVLTVASGTSIKYPKEYVTNHLVIDAEDHPSFNIG